MATLPQARSRGRGEDGYLLAGALFLMAVMAIGMTVAVMEWSFLHQRDLEKELEFRGDRIMRALLEYKEMQQSGKKSPAKVIQDYETMEKFLTEEPNPILAELPPDPFTARYDERGELEEDTGKWGLVLLGASIAPTPSNPRPNQGLQIVGCPPPTRRSRDEGEGGSLPQFPGAPRSNRVSQWDTEFRGQFGEDSLSQQGIGSSGPGLGQTRKGNIVGVVSCRDDLDPIGLSPSGEETASYREWLFVPRELQTGGGLPAGGGGAFSSQGQTTGGAGGRPTAPRPGSSPAAGQTAAQQQAALQAGGTLRNNWPDSMPAPPEAPVPGVQPPGQGPGRGIPGLDRNRRRGSAFGNSRGSSFGGSRRGNDRR